MCARFVGYLYGVVHGNGAAAGGWMGRAVRLIEAAGDCAERARIELTRAVVTADPVARERHLTAAVEIAQRYGDTDIVLDAMSQRGLHLVAAGEVDAGMALLDEALAAVAAGRGARPRLGRRDVLQDAARLRADLATSAAPRTGSRSPTASSSGPTASRSARSAAPTTAGC